MVEHGRIAVSETDPSSKATLAHSIAVADFRPGQHVALWMSIQAQLTDASKTAEQVENNGQLAISDLLQYRFMGGGAARRVV